MAPKNLYDFNKYKNPIALLLNNTQNGKIKLATDIDLSN